MAGLVALAVAALSSSDPGPLPRLETPEAGVGLTPPLTTGSLESRLRQVALTRPGVYGVVVYDPSSGRTVALDADRRFMAASLAKLPVLITLYRAAAGGELSLDEKITLLPSDVAGYGSGVLDRYPPGYTMTLRECATYLIKESDNTAWLMLERRLGRERIEAELQRLGADDTDYRNFSTTPNDVLLMLRSIEDPTFTTPALSEEMIELMTNTAYEDRIPQPLPEETSVAHKVGSYADTFSDAGIVFYEGPEGEKRRYFIVVMGDGMTEAGARSAIRMMSMTTYRALVDSSAERRTLSS